MNMYIGNLSYNVRESDLRQVMEEYGLSLIHIWAVGTIRPRPAHDARGDRKLRAGIPRRLLPEALYPCCLLYTSLAHDALGQSYMLLE